MSDVILSDFIRMLMRKEGKTVASPFFIFGKGCAYCIPSLSFKVGADKTNLH